jgi:DNA repair photolyase
MGFTILERKSSVLMPALLPCLGHLPTLRFASGCSNGCLDCCAQGPCAPKGAEVLNVARDPVSRLQSELTRRRTKPLAVCIDFASDPFQAAPELLERTYEVLQYLLCHGIGVVFQSNARIPLRHMELLLAHAPLVRAIVPLVTTNLRTMRIFEPHTATPRVRLRQMRELAAGGVTTLARVDPILPGVTDDPDTMHALCAALAEAGICEIAAGVLVLRPAFVNALRYRLGRPQVYRRLIQSYDGGSNARLPGFEGMVRMLPTARRRRIFQWLTTIAGQYGMHVHVCNCKDPDLASESCKLGGQWSPPEIVERQLGLFA